MEHCKSRQVWREEEKKKQNIVNKARVQRRFCWNLLFEVHLIEFYFKYKSEKNGLERERIEKNTVQIYVKSRSQFEFERQREGNLLKTTQPVGERKKKEKGKIALIKTRRSFIFRAGQISFNFFPGFLLEEKLYFSQGFFLCFIRLQQQDTAKRTRADVSIDLPDLRANNRLNY